MKPTIAIDIAKNVFEIAVSRHPGKVAERHRLSRTKLLRFFAQRPPSRILLEACGSAHFWARELQKLGHEVVLLPPHLVRPYRRRHQKTDRADAKALLEAFRNEQIQPVPIKTVEQHSLAALHRLRSAWIATRTARINAVRGILRELGHFIPQGAHHVVPRVWELIEDADSGLPDPLRAALAEACREIRDLEQRSITARKQLEALAPTIPAVEHLLSVPGIGKLTATALVAFVAEIYRFPSGRHFASYLGLTPREHSSGNRRRLGHISKQGDTYLRMLLVHGARSCLAAAKRYNKKDPLHEWALQLKERRGHNRATVALANKIARIAWKVWKEDRDYWIERQAA
ncbi:MAG: IS110 family transposase [bacterium]|nr:IS110 family transposase [bacterium]